MKHIITMALCLLCLQSKAQHQDTLNATLQHARREYTFWSKQEDAVNMRYNKDHDYGYWLSNYPKTIIYGSYWAGVRDGIRFSQHKDTSIFCYPFTVK